MSYKVMVLAHGEKSFVGNGIRYATLDDARLAGSDLFGRWTMVKEWHVESSDDPANREASGIEASKGLYSGER